MPTNPKIYFCCPPEDTQHDQSVTAPLLFLTIAAVIPAGSVTPELGELRQSKPPVTRVLVPHGDAAMMITSVLSRTGLVDPDPAPVSPTGVDRLLSITRALYWPPGEWAGNPGDGGR